MKRHYVTFSGARYFDTTNRIVGNAPKYGADNVLVYDDWWLQHCRPAYWDRVRWFRQQRWNDEAGPRGVDFFVFKPYVILDALRRIDPGDVLLWSDADTYPIADLRPFYDRCVTDGGALFFAARGCLNKWYTKRDVFVLMGCDSAPYYEAWQTVGRFMLFRKPTGEGLPGTGGPEFDSERFLLDWLAYTANPFINTFEPSVISPDQEELKQSRCEQSVLSLLRQKYGMPLYREACEFGCWKGETDPNREIDFPGHQTFSQVGGHSYRPGFAGDHFEGSSFRNVS